MKRRSLTLLLVAFATSSLLVSVQWLIRQQSNSAARVSNIYGSTLATNPLGQDSKAVKQLYSSPPSTYPSIASRCDRNAIKEFDMQQFKSWRQGVVTVVEPEIPGNCTALFIGANQTEISRVTQANQNWNSSRYDRKFSNTFLDSEDCEDIRAEFSGNFYISNEELLFPLAFSINIHTELQQIVRLMKFIYRPHNVYCIHYDQKSSSKVKKVFNILAKCLQNVIIPKHIVSIVYGCYHILEAQLSCLSALLSIRRRFPWKYVTTLCGRELPLRTNREMVRFFREKKGLPVIYISEFSSEEISLKLHYTRINKKKDRCTATFRVRSKPVPYGMKLLKTMAYISLPPNFTDFVLHSSEAKALYEFVKPIGSPEEAFYGTLLHYWINRTAAADMNIPRIHIADTIWLSWDDEWKKHCRGSSVHRVCVVSSGDLHRLKYRTDPLHVTPPLFHNKYSMSEDHTVMDCMEKLLVERNKLEYIRDTACTI